MRIYVASSWRNPWQPSVVAALAEAGHGVYDFRHPDPGDNGFHWSEIASVWKSWSREEYRSALAHPIAVDGFLKDRKALDEAQAGVLVTPCGQSAHLEAGYLIGQEKPVVVYLAESQGPELMYALANRIVLTEEELVNACGSLAIGIR